MIQKQTSGKLNASSKICFTFRVPLEIGALKKFSAFIRNQLRLVEQNLFEKIFQYKINSLTKPWESDTSIN